MDDEMNDVEMNNMDAVDNIKIIDYKYDLMSKLEESNIDINNISMKSVVKLDKFFKKFNLIELICNIFIHRLKKK